MLPTSLNKQVAPTSNAQSGERDEWFSGLFHSLRTDKMLLDTGAASEDQQRVYETLMKNDYIASAAMSKEFANRILTREAVVSFVRQVLASQNKPKRLAFDFNTNESSLLVWAVVSDDNLGAERVLYLAEAKVNAALGDAGYRISTTVVEESDELPVPSHYEELSLEKMA